MASDKDGGVLSTIGEVVEDAAQAIEDWSQKAEVEAEQQVKEDVDSKFISQEGVSPATNDKQVPDYKQKHQEEWEQAKEDISITSAASAIVEGTANMIDNAKKEHAVDKEA